jgi:hypothetical protein
MGKTLGERGLSMVEIKITKWLGHAVIFTALLARR